MATKKKAGSNDSSPKDVFAIMDSLEDEREFHAIELQEKSAADFLSTGCLSLDLGLGGGYYGGQVIQFYGPEHSGKCLPASTIVHTADGLMTIGEVFDRAGSKAVCTPKVVDYEAPFMNRYGEQENCSRLFMNGKKPVYCLTTETGGQIESTANHPHLVMSEAGNWVWRKTKDLRPGDYLIRSTKASFGAEQLHEDEAYFVGALIADGHFSEYRVGITNDDQDVLSVVERVGAQVLGVDPKTYDRSETSAAFHFNSKEKVAQFYSDWGIDPTTAAFKRVPQRVRGFNKDSAAAFLRGYFDCESYADRRGIEVASASFDLLHDVKLMLQMMGIIGVIRKNDVKEYPDNDYWRLFLTGQDFRLFIDRVGSSSSRVTSRYDDALSYMADKGENTHKHSIPHMGRLLRDLYDSCNETKQEDNRLFEPVMGESPAARLTYKRLRSIVDKTGSASWNQSLRNILLDIERADYFYDKIDSLEPAGEQPVFDLEMPETHSFVANGFVTHNSTMGYSSAAYLTSVGVPVAYLDYEGTTDKAYTQQPGIGVDYKKVRYFRPPTTEAGYDWIYDFCSRLDDKHSGLPQAVIFVDTIAAMLPEVWVENPKNKQPGRDAAAHSLGWKRIQTLITNKHVSIVAMNQIRANVGNPYQAPENLPGGNAWKFATGNLVRVGRGKVEQTPDGEMFQLMRFKTQKNKNFIPLQEVQVHLHLGWGIDPASDVCAFAQMAGYFFKRKRTKDKKDWIYSKTGKGLPSLRGLDEYVPGVDGDYASLSELHERIREEGKGGDVYRACRMALQQGDAIQRYRKSKSKLEIEEEDVSTLSAKREKVSAIDVEAATEDEEFEAVEPAVEAPKAQAKDEDETPAALGSQKKKAAAKKKTAAKKKASTRKKTPAKKKATSRKTA